MIFSLNISDLNMMSCIVNLRPVLDLTPEPFFLYFHHNIKKYTFHVRRLIMKCKNVRKGKEL